jgi:hypothetical protein
MKSKYHHHHPFPGRRHHFRPPPPSFGDDLARSQHAAGGDPFLVLAEKAVFVGFAAVACPILLVKSLIEHGIERSKFREMTQKMTAAGLPTPAQVTARFKTKRKKTLTQALELGAMLLALTPTLDARRVRATDGQLGGRGRGLKGWLAQYCPTVGYSSASRYRKLAERFLDYLQFEKTSASWTMSWILPDKPLPVTDDEDTLDAVRQTRATVSDLLRRYPSQRALHRLLATELPTLAKPS